MAVESAARHLRGLSPERRVQGQDEEGDAQAILMPTEAKWILAPSVALTRNGFRQWSPLFGLTTFLGAASRSLSHDLGQLGTLRHELARLEAMISAAHGRSRLADLIEFLKAQPVVNSAMVIDRLGVTRRTALSLIGELVDAGCLVNLTARRAARRLQGAPPPKRPGETGAHPSRLHEQFDEARLDRIMSDLDAAMAGIDRLLKGRA